MSERTVPQKQKKTRKRGGWILPFLCNLLGTVFLLAVIAVLLPVTLPKVMGFQVYRIVSASMEPTIPVGSIVYVEPARGSEIELNEIIAFQDEGSVVTHRVKENHPVEGEFITQGDANAVEDLTPVAYSSLIGRVKYHFPYMGDLMYFVTGTLGKVYLVCVIACGVMLQILAHRLRDR
ncbi:MAG: signal peptidase I [Oscillospiraceae bacterium]|nr:signal peptidase I [Oscillospiraceae bacterium]